ncbi:hypothetical protein Q1695_014217 [Nippostrongylus brasiliensis]|nr:hypothetical protein Q1695_014217 [Nippostrongylus brasiliensis]
MKRHCRRPRIYYYFIALTILISLIVHYLVNLLHDEPILSQQDFSYMVKKRYGNMRVVEEICIEEHCYIIRDALDNQDGKIYLERELLQRDLTDGSLRLRASAPLLVPTVKTLRTVDSRKWLIGQDLLRDKTADQAVIEAAHLAKALPVDSGARVKLLVVGIGSATVSNFIHRRYKKAEIVLLEKHNAVARFLMTWFQIDVSPEYEIYTGDEMSNIQKLSDEGAKFDIVYYNMCMQSFGPLPCPSETEVTDKDIRNIVKLVGPKGVFILTLMTESTDGTDSYGKAS